MYRILLATLAVCLIAGTAYGWDFDKHSIPVDQILSGGPPKDGIPALLTPRFATSAESGLEPEDRVIGFVSGGDARAYPMRIMSWHELVNDEVNGKPVLVSW
jgi:hypothetical protein